MDSTCNVDIYDVTYTLTSDELIGAKRVDIDSLIALDPTDISITAEKVTLRVRIHLFTVSIPLR